MLGLKPTGFNKIIYHGLKAVAMLALSRRVKFIEAKVEVRLTPLDNFTYVVDRHISYNKGLNSYRKSIT